MNKLKYIIMICKSYTPSLGNKMFLIFQGKILFLQISIIFQISIISI